jgi:hypothetical protein
MLTFEELVVPRQSDRDQERRELGTGGGRLGACRQQLPCLRDEQEVGTDERGLSLSPTPSVQPSLVDATDGQPRPRFHVAIHRGERNALRQFFTHGRTLIVT